MSKKKSKKSKPNPVVKPYNVPGLFQYPKDLIEPWVSTALGWPVVGGHHDPDDWDLAVEAGRHTMANDPKNWPPPDPNTRVWERYTKDWLKRAAEEAEDEQESFERANEEAWDHYVKGYIVPPVEEVYHGSSKYYPETDNYGNNIYP